MLKVSLARAVMSLRMSVATLESSAPSPPRRSLRPEREFLALHECPQCAYDLRGLPRRHVCPECGLVYDETMFVVHAWTKDEYQLPETQLLLAKTWRARIWPMLRCGVGVAYLAILGWIIYAMPGFTFLGIVLGIAIAGTIWRSATIRRAHQRRMGTMRWVFSLDGVAQQMDNKPIRWIAWERIRVFDMRRFGVGAWRVRLAEGRFGAKFFRPSEWTLSGSTAFDGVVMLPERQAAVFRREIRGRLRTAQSSDENPNKQKWRSLTSRFPPNRFPAARNIPAEQKPRSIPPW